MDSMESSNTSRPADDEPGHVIVRRPLIISPEAAAGDLTVWQYDRLPDGTLRDVPHLVTLYLPSH